MYLFYLFILLAGLGPDYSFKDFFFLFVLLSRPCGNTGYSTERSRPCLKDKKILTETMSSLLFVIYKKKFFFFLQAKREKKE